MKKKSVRILSAILLVAGLLIGSATAITIRADARKSPYKTNDNGLTYGGINPYADPEDEEMPQLIAAIGIDGTEGYIYASELDSPVRNPEEAVKYMEQLNKEIEVAKAANEPYLRYIPLYDNDGATVIGKYGISYSVPAEIK